MKTYKFLVSNGNGAASRGMDVDYYSTYEIQAKNDKDAYNQLLIEILGYETIEDYLLEYCYGADSVEELTEKEKKSFEKELKNFNGKDELDNMDITGGDPWVEGLKVDDEVIIEPDLESMRYYGFEFSDESYSEWNLPMDGEDYAEADESDILDAFDYVGTDDVDEIREALNERGLDASDEFIQQVVEEDSADEN